MKGGTTRELKRSLRVHEEPCTLCGGTMGSLVQNTDEVVHALCATRAEAGLPTPCLGHLCPVCEGEEAKRAGCAGCSGEVIIGREQMLSRVDDRRYDHPDVHPRVRRGLRAHSKPCKACGGTVGMLSEEIPGETIHALCKTRRAAGMETPCLGHPCKPCQGVGGKDGEPCKHCGGAGRTGARQLPKPKPNPHSKTVRKS